MARLVLALAVLLAVLTALTASAAVLEVDGGVLQVFRLRAEIDLSSLRVTVDIKPETLEKRLQGEPVIAFIDLPDGYDEADIEVSTVRLCWGTDPCATGVAPGSTPPARVVGGRLRVGFDRAAVLALVADVPPPATVTFTVSGRLSSGRPFQGSDTVMLVSPGGPPAPAGGPAQTTSEGTPAATSPPAGSEATPQPTEPAATPQPEPVPQSTPEVTPQTEPTPQPTPEATPPVEEPPSVEPSPEAGDSSAPGVEPASPPATEPDPEPPPQPATESVPDSTAEESLPATPEPTETATP